MSAEVVGNPDDDVEGVVMRPPRREAKSSRWNVVTCAVVSVAVMAQLAALLRIRGHVGALHLRFGLPPESPARPGGKFRYDYRNSHDGVAAAELAHLRAEIRRVDKQLNALSDSVLQAQVRNLEEELRRLRQGAGAQPGAPPYLEFPPEIMSVQINVGPNISPMIMCDEAGSIMCILLELSSSAATYLKELYKGHNRTMVFNLGIAPYYGLVSFPLLNDEGVSTSLNKVGYNAGWNIVQGHDFAGVVTLADVLDSIHPVFAITLLATDMQGYDFDAVRSAGERLKRVHTVLCETYKDGHATYAGVTNAIDADWTPYMAAMGFSLEACTDGFRDEVAWELDCAFTNDNLEKTSWGSGAAEAP